MGANHAPQSGPTPPPHEDGTFRAVGVSRAVGSPNFWSNSEDGLLFLFHLHGFEALARYAAGERSAVGDAFWEDMVRSWLESHSHPQRLAWHPYPTSNRVVAWSAALSSVHGWSDEIRARVAREILLQARYLSRTVEHDIGGNHVIRNGLALAVAGAVFPTAGLLERGLRVLRRGTAHQILPDGGHEERSTSYHLEVLHDLKDVSELIERIALRVPAWLSDAISRMARWSDQMRGPDLRLPLLNDAWEAPPTASRDAAPITDLRDSGYSILRDGQDQLIFDSGPLSPPHLPPHAHADALSFVLWADGEQVLVDPGAFTYTGPRRAEFRGTRAHNTVEVDGEDQCVFWGDFRLAFAPRVLRVPPRHHEGVVILGGSHDGYGRLAEPVRHCRNLVWWPGQGVVAIDLLRGGGRHRIRSPLHLAAGSAPDRAGPFEIRPLTDQVTVERTTGQYAPYVGEAVSAPVLEASAMLEPETPFGWSLLRPPARVLAVERDQLVVEAKGRTVAVPLVWNL